MDLQKEKIKQEFWNWAKVENPRVVENAELGDVYATQILDHMFMGFAAAKAQSDKKIKLLLCDEHLQKCESPTGVFNSQYPDEEPCLICLAKEAKAQAVPEWISVKDKLPPANILVLGMSQTRSNIFNVYNVMALDEFEEAEVTHWMPLPDAPQEQAND